TESNLSKLLIIGNKKDLIEKTDLKRIKNELSIPDFKEISLNSLNAKSEIQDYISEILGLKEKIPENFTDLIKEVDQLALEGKKIQALAKYKELMGISESYQDIMITKNLMQKIKDLNKRIKDEAEKRKEIEKTKEFEVAKPLIFTRKITVKPLPTSDSSIEQEDVEPSEKKLTPPPKSPLKKLVSFQMLEKETEVKPLKISKPPLKIIKKIPPPKEIKKEPQFSKVDDQAKPKAKMPMELFEPYQDIKKDMDRPLVIDFIKELQNMITEKGSSLSIALCEKLITDLQKSLERPLTIDDVKLAAEFFVKQEKLI
ncbi:MAG: hypothetical protein ACFFDF_17920, partial [Candidatus Odinarchaeota archaeon]